MRAIWGVSAALLGLLIGVSASWAATIHVPGEYPTIQEAVDAAAYGDEVLVAPGDSYASPIHEAGAGDTTFCCAILKSGIKLRGSGMGQTIIDADSLGRVLHLYQCENVEISHLTVTGGFAEFYGSGIFCRESSPYIHDVEVIDNYDGGISMIEDSDPVIEFVRMERNHAKAGGGLDVELECEPLVYRCEIIDNSAPFAGGVRLRGSATLDHCLIDNNRTSGAVNVLGGGILVVDRAIPTIRYCDITNNVCFGDGAGISIIGELTDCVLEHCLIDGNVSTGLEARGAGISVGSLADASIQDCIVSNNVIEGTWGDGGGLYVQYASADVSNCTFYANWSEADSTLMNLVGNVGFELLPGMNEATMTHCIIASSPRGIGLYCSGADPTVSCCDVYGNRDGDETCGIGDSNFSLDPLLCDPATGNYHIQDASPCAPGNHPEGPDACDGLLIGAKKAGCSSDVPDVRPDAVARLLGNRPNPFTGSTVISFALEKQQDVSLDILDVSGRRVALLCEGAMSVGVQQVTWDGTTLSGGRAESGVYFYRLRCGEVTEGLRMLRLR